MIGSLGLGRSSFFPDRIHGYRAGQARVSLSYAYSLLLEKAAPGKGMKGPVPAASKKSKRAEPSKFDVIYVTLR